MKAMVLAAGLGTRLRPLTDGRPKALVELGGRALLEIVLTRLRSFGVTDVIVNVHHYSDMIADYLRMHHNFGMRIELSSEEILLDTGGGLKNAAWFFLDGPNADEPFILHNVDVFSTIDLGRMIRFHLQNTALATLAVQERQSSRYLLFDPEHQLCGRKKASSPEPEIVRPSPQLQPLAFSGIHVISPRILPMLTEGGVFSIIASYMRLAGGGQRILGFRTDEYWRDLGRPGDLEQAEEDLKQGIIPN